MTVSGMAGMNRKICDDGEVAVGGTVNAWKAINMQSKYIIQYFNLKIL